MSVDYSFYPKESIDKNINEFRNKNYFFEGYIIHNAEGLSELFGLPEIPYYYCIDDHPYKYLNNKAWFRSNDLYNHYNNLYIERATCKWTGKEIKRYKAYCHWINWGLKKLKSITINDILKCSKCQNKEVYINTLEDIKREIPKILELYKKNYYMLSEV